MRSRLRRFFLRHLPLAVACIVVLLALLSVGLYFVASSAAFENVVRKRLIASIEDLTGGRAEIASFHWRLLHFEAEADGLVIHGLEDPGEAPYAQIERLRVHLSVRNLFSPHIRLRSLEIDHPSLHLIVYPDGSTNQPHPRKPRKSRKSALDTLFDMQAGHIAVEQGILHYDNRAAAFDYQNRYAPLDFEANDVSVLLRYLPAAKGTPETYRIEAGATDLNLSRAVPRGKSTPVHGTLQATIDLERARLLLRSLRLTAHSPETRDRSLEVSGDVEDFTHPRWQAKAVGDLDMRLLDPITGYPDAPEGIAHLDLAAGGQADAFHIDGPIHVDGGSYIGAGVIATGITLDARVHADPRQLLITQIVARLRQGGQIEGSVELQPWLPSLSAATVQPQRREPRAHPDRNTLVRSAPWIIPVNGKVTAEFQGRCPGHGPRYGCRAGVPAPGPGRPPQRHGCGDLVRWPGPQRFRDCDSGLEPLRPDARRRSARNRRHRCHLHAAQRRRGPAQAGVAPARQRVGGARRARRLSGDQPVGAQRRFSYP